MRKSSSANDPSMGFRPLRRFPAQAATHIRLTSPDFAASLGFLNLVTLSSACTPTALSHAESVRGVPCLQRIPPPARRHDFRRALPLLPFVAPKRERLQGLMRSGDPFASSRCYPGPDGRSSPDILPSQGMSPRVSALHRCKTSSHGLFTTPDNSNAVTALQSVKELKGKTILFRDLSPSSGLALFALGQKPLASRAPVGRAL
jgi:hypothetical protein